MTPPTSLPTPEAKNQPQRQRRGVEPASCGGCDSRWSGHRRAHCSVCHNTFGGVLTFDKHRRNGVCRPPQDLGLFNVDGIWKAPWVGRNL